MAISFRGFLHRCGLRLRGVAIQRRLSACDFVAAVTRLPRIASAAGPQVGQAEPGELGVKLGLAWPLC
jgi:hypothetical protein